MRSREERMGGSVRRPVRSLTPFNPNMARCRTVRKCLCREAWIVYQPTHGFVRSVMHPPSRNLFGGVARQPETIAHGARACPRRAQPSWLVWWRSSMTAAGSSPRCRPHTPCQARQRGLRKPGTQPTSNASVPNPSSTESHRYRPPSGFPEGRRWPLLGCSPFPQGAGARRDPLPARLTT